MKQDILNSMNVLFEQKCTQVNDAFPSLYSKDDVLKVIEQLKNSVIKALEQVNDENLSSAKTYTMDEIFDVFNHDVDVASYCEVENPEFELDDNKIYLHDYDVNVNFVNMMDDIEHALKVRKLENN